jgi:hypothetical protein
MNDHEVEVTLTPERIKLYERAMVIGLPAIVVSMYGDRIQKLIDDERNKVASWMMTKGYATGHGDTVEDLLQELGTEIEAKIAAEREEIIQMMPGGSGVDPQWVCDAIRARGQV